MNMTRVFEEIKFNRRRHLGAVGMTAAATQRGFIETDQSGYPLSAGIFEY